MKAKPNLRARSILWDDDLKGSWILFELPKRSNEYVFAVKTMGEDTGEDKNYFNVIEVFDRTDERVMVQVAEYRSTIDIDLFAQEVIKGYRTYKGRYASHLHVSPLKPAWLRCRFSTCNP